MKNRVLLPIQLDDIDNYDLNKLSKTPSRLVSIDELFKEVKPSLKNIGFTDKNDSPVNVEEFGFKKLDNFQVYGNEGIINRIPLLKQMKKEVVMFTEMENNPGKLCKVANDNDLKALFKTSLDNFINIL